MSKPAQKEPSMDEILSSIRQIIADDDTGEARKMAFEIVPSDDSASDSAEAISDAGVGETLALSQAQIVKDESVEDASVVDFSTYTAEASDDQTESEIAAMNEEADMAIATEMKAEFVDPDDVAFDGPGAFAAEAPRPVAMPTPSVRQRPTAAQAAPMPDPNLSRDIAEELLEPATNAAVRANLSKLNNFAIGNAGITIEQVVRDMLRPMLKEWLDEHLPAVVERMVEREISRISNGD
jgi:cell pole-organizing protein PopZ